MRTPERRKASQLPGSCGGRNEDEAKRKLEHETALDYVLPLSHDADVKVVADLKWKMKGSAEGWKRSMSKDFCRAKVDLSGTSGLGFKLTANRG